MECLHTKWTRWYSARLSDYIWLYCGGLLNVGIYDSNGGIEQIDLATDTVVNTLTRASLGEGRVSGVACDQSTDTLYVTFYQDEEPIKKYNMNSGIFLSDISTQTHNLPSDRIWWDAIDYANGELIVGHGLGQSGSNVIGGGYSVITTSGAITSQVNSNAQGSSLPRSNGLELVGYLVKQVAPLDTVVSTTLTLQVKIPS